MFVNLLAEPRGRALTYPAVYDLVLRLRRRTGIDFDPHWFRHTMATRALRDGVPIEVVSKLLGHASITTTSTVYGHLTAEDARKTLAAAGWFTDGRGAPVTAAPLQPAGPAGLLEKLLAAIRPEFRQTTSLSTRGTRCSADRHAPSPTATDRLAATACAGLTESAGLTQGART